MTNWSENTAASNNPYLKGLFWPSFGCAVVTGYNQSVTDCGSQRRHVVVTQQKLI